MAIRINKAGYSYILSSVALGVIFRILEMQALAGLMLVFLVFFIWFFRDPDRVSPEEKGVIVSPADGRVKFIMEEHSKELNGPAKIVHIFLSPFDVHINRSPVKGKVVSTERAKGSHAPAFLMLAGSNEQNRIKIKFGKDTLIVTQIVGIFARRIKCWVSKNQNIDIGERIGLIMFGSGTRLIMPAKAEILVKEGEKVKGGETIIAKLK